MKKFRISLGFIFLFSLLCFADSYSGSSKDTAVIVRSPVWVFLETEPGSFDGKTKDAELPPKEALKELSGHILGGMTYGWKFSYTPYDKKRGVKEFFEIVPIVQIEKNDKNIVITDVKIKYPFCYCWVEYKISEAQAVRMKFWKSISHKTVKGRGTGERSDELKGVYNAYTEAVKNAVREYARKVIKNKPKELIGELLIKENPRLYVESGLFKAELELYLNIEKIVPYTVF
ncbi:hypothetical protein [Treponema pedis]|uniref:hypothetical protein n=1 Tax=Treponema pedis TaxID=409322 RepID=UPI0003F4CF77|nr:hypothetical protein [Treponema pedis]